MKLSLALAAASVMTTAAFAAVESGLKPGAQPKPFDVVDVTGPNKPDTLCYRWSYGAAPVIAVFVNGDASKAAGLVAQVQKLVDTRKAKGLKSFVVFMGGKEYEAPIMKIRKQALGKISDDSVIPMTYLARGSTVQSYNISPQAQNTILLWKGMRVQGNFVDVDSKSFSSVEKAADEMLK